MVMHAWIVASCKFARDISPLSMTQSEWVKHRLPGLSLDQMLAEENYKTYRDARNEWNDAMRRALSLGQVSPEDADKKGFVMEPRHGPMPAMPLYHVTTSKDAVIKNGLLTRSEMSQEQGAGLGGGSSDTISFTTDMETARGILSNMREARDYARGEMTFDDMYDMSKKGEGADRPWLKEWLSYYGSKNGEMTRGIKDTLEGIDRTRTIMPMPAKKMYHDGWSPVRDSKWKYGKDLYTEWIRKTSPRKQAEDKFELFKTWSSFREAAGGPLDPLYFLSDPLALAAVPENQMAILEFKAKPGAHGHQVSSLGEWRTYSGDAVELVGEVT